MTKVRSQIAMSLDGFVAGPNQSEENPLGEGGEQLHEWVFELEAFNKTHGREGGVVNESTPIVEGMFANVGAVIMGRNMFGPIRGDWGDESWNGWWGDDPPYHVPTYVLTHHARDSVEMQGGTTFHFVTDGPQAALDRARSAAGAQDVLVMGGAQCQQQFLALGVIEEMIISLAPVLLGSGERLLANLGDKPPGLEQVDSIKAPGVTHLKYTLST